MRDPELSKRIKKRILESKREYAPQEQIAELLLRNELFCSGAATFTENEAVKFGVTLTPEELELMKAPSPEWGLRGEYGILWLIKWGIKFSWDGRKETLAENINNQPEVFFRPMNTTAEMGVLSCGLQVTELSSLIGAAWEKNISSEEQFIYIRMRQGTKQTDLDNLWPALEKLQRSVFYYNDRKKETFGRDLCWYDLNKKEEYGKLSLGRIRNLWIRFFPKQTPPPRVTIQKAIERIARYSDRLTPDSNARF